MTRPRLLAVFLVLVAAVLSPHACGSPPRPLAPTPSPTLTTPEREKLWSDARDVFETRCVVCHGCYDTPCQLKLGTLDGIERGATTAKVYDNSRLLAAEPTRLGIDARDVEGWRKKGFHSVVVGGDGSDPRASLLLRMLDLKRANPLPVMSDIAILDLVPSHGRAVDEGGDGFSGRYQAGPGHAGRRGAHCAPHALAPLWQAARGVRGEEKRASRADDQRGKRNHAESPLGRRRNERQRGAHGAPSLR